MSGTSSNNVPGDATPTKIDGEARVSVVRLTSYDPGAVHDALHELLDPLGGIGAFVAPGTGAVLKPNFLRPARVERAVSTHPEIIRAVARLAREAGASRVEVTDSPGIGTAKRCAERLGIEGQAEPFSVVEADDGFDAEAREGAYRRLKLSRRMVEADALINLPKVKTHGQMVITAAVKNTFGAVVGMEKAQWHMRAGRDPMDFAKLICHVHCLVSPALNIVDGVVGMDGNGPGSGTPRPLGILMASVNAHALDWVLCRVLKINPEDVFTLRAAKLMSLLPPESEIEIVGGSLEKLRIDGRWRLARPVLSRSVFPGWAIPLVDSLLSVTPRVSAAACIGCGECVTVCASQAMRLSGERTTVHPVVTIDTEKCISCFCCQEMCPTGAIDVKAGLVARLLGLGVR